MASTFKFKVVCGNICCGQKSIVRLGARLFSTVHNSGDSVTGNDNRINFVTSNCDIEELEKVQELVRDNLLVYDEFISPQEEEMLFEESKENLERQNYHREHWDDAIHGYRELEKEMWSRDCMVIFKRMKDLAFDAKHNLLPYVHVLDLDASGFIKPHIDSVKFCGSTIAGLSLLSPSIMRYRHDSYSGIMVDTLLSRRSLYICRNAVRYQFTHEILPPNLSNWKGNHIERKRRISVILRCEPEPDAA